MKNRKIELNGASLEVTERGSGEPALLFLHYWGGSGRTAQPVIDRLPETLHCIAVDQRGWGRSSREGDVRLEANAADVTALIGKLGLSHFILVGHSMGGKIAQMVASERPKGLEGLVLIAPAPPVAIRAPEQQRSMMLESYQSREGVGMALAVLAEKPLSAELREQVIADTLAGSPAAKAAWPSHGMLTDITEMARNISVPTLVIVGDADRVETEETLRREIPAVIPQAAFAILPGVGHLSPLEAPDEVAAHIKRFVDTLGQ
jgi:pimeloyl-ACP methyl ester carboxylesterase